MTNRMPWSGRRRRILAVAVALFAVAAACTVPGGGEDLGSLKRSAYGAYAQAEAAATAAGTGQATVEFVVADTPPSVFYNYVVPDAQAAAFEAFIGLPPGFSLAKVKMLESDAQANYWMSLNIYRVTGITTGLRAEWNTYVDDGSGVPRFMIIRARAAEGSIDPIGPLAQPEPFSHSIDGSNLITTALNKTVIENDIPVLTNDNQFNSTIQLPDEIDRVFGTPTLEWTGANDLIYWMNGVYDRVMYNGNVHDAAMLSVDLNDVTIQNDSEFVPYLEADPEHVLVYLNPLEFAIGPWWNVTEPNGLVEEGERLSLLAFKTNLYSGFMNTQAVNVLTGNAQPVVRTQVEEGPSSTYWHWKIPGANLAAFEAVLNLPAGMSPAPVKVDKADAAADYWLTLNVYEVSSINSGLRAEWSTYVDDGTATRKILIDTRTDHASLDPLVGNVAPSTLTHTEAGGTISTTVGDPGSEFTSSFAAPVPGPGNAVVAATEWVNTHDITYWANGIADNNYYNSEFFRKVDVAPGSVSITDNSQWATFVGATPDKVWVNAGETEYVNNPWLGV
ncbi:MAG: hypothetical protein GY812_13215 [Actinomycetia bacterium]|nr:hypothetical protein [Actinomycetes bacterium]